MEKADALMKEAVRLGAFPGGVLHVSVDNKVVFQQAYGNLRFSSGHPIEIHTVFDLASLTKSLATAPAIMMLVQEGRLGLDTKVSDILSELKKSDKHSITIAQLLCHNSGLPDYKPYYKVLRELPENLRLQCLRQLLVDEPLVNSVGGRVVYSDIGYMFLSWVVEKITGKTIDRFVEKKIFIPLCIDDLYYILRPSLRGTGVNRYAPTEDCPWRKKILTGEVHDDNAWILGQASGHAGLFGTVNGVARLLTEYLDSFHGRIESQVFNQDVLRKFLTEYKNTRRAPGFDMPSVKASSSGKYFTQTSIGHLGFTGTSFWVDLERSICIVLLTNRVHPSRENIRIRQFRPLIHDAVMEWVLNS